MWKLIKQIARIDTDWMSLVGEVYMTERGKQLDYWRTESVSSTIAITTQSGNFILPKKQFRPGVNKLTLDFPGGRVEEGEDEEVTMRAVIQRELNIGQNDILSLEPVFSSALLVNSSTSNQKLFGYIAQLSQTAKLGPHTAFSQQQSGVRELLGELECLQCRALLLEYLQRNL